MTNSTLGANARSPSGAGAWGAEASPEAGDGAAGAEWLRAFLAVCQARGSSASAKDREGCWVAANPLFRQRVDRGRPLSWGAGPPCVVAAEQEAQRSGAPVSFVHAVEHGFALATAFPFRRHILYEGTPIDRSLASDLLARAHPSLSSARIAFVVALLERVGPTPTGPLRLEDLPAPRSTVGRILRELEGAGHIARERAQRGLWVRPQLRLQRIQGLHSTEADEGHS